MIESELADKLRLIAGARGHPSSFVVPEDAFRCGRWIARAKGLVRKPAVAASPPPRAPRICNSQCALFVRCDQTVTIEVDPNVIFITYNRHRMTAAGAVDHISALLASERII